MSLTCMMEKIEVCSVIKFLHLYSLLIFLSLDHIDRSNFHPSLSDDQRNPLHPAPEESTSASTGQAMFAFGKESVSREPSMLTP